MAVALRIRCPVSLPCVVGESAACGKESHRRSEFSSRCTLLPKSKNSVKRNPSLQSTIIHLPPPPPLQFSNLHCAFVARRSASAESRASTSASASNFHCVLAARRSASAESCVSASASPSSSDTTESPKPEAVTFKHVLLPVIDRNPYLSESTRQTIATTTTLAKQYGADVTVVVIDHHDSAENETKDGQETKEKHDLQIQTVRWHLSEGGCAEYTLVERSGKGQKPAAVIGEMADDLGLDLVIMSMEAIHQKHVDGNLLVWEYLRASLLALSLPRGGRSENCNWASGAKHNQCAAESICRVDLIQSLAEQCYGAIKIDNRKLEWKAPPSATPVQQ